MARIRPFKALRPKPGLAASVASRPYDVLSAAEAREEVKENPLSFLHVTRAEVDLPPDTGPYSVEVYQQADRNLKKLVSEGILQQDESPCYYVYELTMNGRSQTGLVGLSSVEDYFGDVIRKHEFTRPEKEKDRIDHMQAIRAQTGNVFLAYRDVLEVNALIAGWKMSNKPVYEFTADDDVAHRFWILDRPIVIDSISRLFETKVPYTYIADGHHRAASAAKVSRALRESEAAQYFLTTIFPASQLAILDYNRVVRDLGMDKEDFISALQEDFYITQSSEPIKPAQPHEFGMYLDRQWYILTARKGTFGTDPIGVLDVTILSENILSKLLGIKDQRTDKRIDFVGGIRGLKELEKRVDSGEMAVAFSLHPVSIEQLFAIADSGNVMPPKSTWFEPKLRDGLVTHLI